MAGHSKWANIKHTKSKNDAKRGKIFTKLNRIITVAVKDGGDDPTMNPALRDAIDKAKQNNMPNSNIERTIKKAAGNTEGENYEHVTYEGYGTSGTAVIVDTLTDNKNRTTGNVRHLFDKYGGGLGTTGSASYLFDRKGIIIVNMEDAKMSEEELLEHLIENEAEDVEFVDGICEITTDPKIFNKVLEFVKSKGLEVKNSSIDLIPTATVELDEKKKESFMKMLDKFDEDDDVQEVYHNVENL